MNLNELENLYNQQNKLVIQRTTARDFLEQQLNDKENALALDVKLKDDNLKAHLYLRKQVIDNLQSAIETVNQIVTSVLKRVFGDDYTFALTYNEEALLKGERSGLNINCTITSKMEGDEMTTSVKDSRGGGLLETISVILRWAFLNYLGYNGAIILDESWSAVSADEKMINLVDFINAYTQETSSQIIFITHRAEMFGREASTINRVYKADGLSQIERISFEQIPDKL